MTQSDDKKAHLSAQPSILALESSTAACSVALLVNGDLKQLYEEGVNLHSTRMLSMVDELLTNQGITLGELDAIACGVGPGGFTGLRIGVGIGQGLAFSQQLPMVSVSSLDALAFSVSDELSYPKGSHTKKPITVFAGLDARMQEFYYCHYRIVSGQLMKLSDYQLNKPESFIENFIDTDVFIGNAWSVYEDDLPASIKDNHLGVAGQLPQAKYIALLAAQRYTNGETISAQELAPLYVRNDVAKKSTRNVLLEGQKI